MRLMSVPENIAEAAALVAGAVPTPLMDTLVGLLLAKTIMAATAVGGSGRTGKTALPSICPPLVSFARDGTSA